MKKNELNGQHTPCRRLLISNAQVADWLVLSKLNGQPPVHPIRLLGLSTLLNMVNDRKNGRNHRRAECLLKQLRAAVKKEFGKDMGEILGLPNMTKQDRTQLMQINDGIIVSIDQLKLQLMQLRHHKDEVSAKVKRDTERKALDN